MKEDFLHHVWKFQKFSAPKLYTISGEEVAVKQVGKHNFNVGPDFFNAILSIDHQLWAGNVEIHLKSSDWYAHRHERDANYDNVILHLVWEHDANVYRKNGSAIPTLEVQKIVAKNTLDNYKKLFSKEPRWINCEQDFSEVENMVFDNWIERLFFERLERKTDLILTEQSNSRNHWEALLFRMIAKNFGSRINGRSFLSIARSIDFSIIKKCKKETLELEALLMGQGEFLNEEKEDGYYQELKELYGYLSLKFSLNNVAVETPSFFRLRPSNFPTIRLSQLAVLYMKQDTLFSRIIEGVHKEDFYQIFDVITNPYWQSHYNFGVASKKYTRKLSTKFIDLLIINTVIPIKFGYARFMGQDVSNELIDLALQIAAEDNAQIRKFNELRPSKKSALQSQGLLQLKNEYCDRNRCLNCAIGNTILKQRG